MAIPQVILDTDFSSDPGDLGALVACLTLHKLGYMNLIGVVISSSNSKAPGAVNACLIAFGLGSIPVACLKNATIDPQGPGVWVGPMYDGFPRAVGLADTVEGSTPFYSRLLQAAAPASIDIVALGGATCLAQLLAAQPALVAAKVKELSFAIGDYPSMPTEFNIEFDPTAAGVVFSTWPTPIVYSGYAQGNTIISCANLASSFPLTDIVRKAFNVYGRDAQGRESWDQVGVLWTVFRDSLFTSIKGSNALAGTGNTFTANPAGKDRYIFKAFGNSTYSALLNNLTVAPRAGALASWPIKQAFIGHA